MLLVRVSQRRGAPSDSSLFPSLFLSLFLPVIFGRFPAFALIFLQILHRPPAPAPLYRDLQVGCTPLLRHE
jgi:hypothetical protein